MWQMTAEKSCDNATGNVVGCRGSVIKQESLGTSLKWLKTTGINDQAEERKAHRATWSDSSRY
jgi:hypothetical protein